MKILVIDDEKPTLSMFRLFLTAYGYEVHTADSGEAGLEAFETLVPDMVFTDIRMPGIDGLEVLRRIRRSHPRCQVVIITGHGDLERAVEAMDLGASDFINKPVERQALNAALIRAEQRMARPEPVPFAVMPCPEGGDEACFDVRGRLSGKSGPVMAEVLKGIGTGVPVCFRFSADLSMNREGISLLMDMLKQLSGSGHGVRLTGLSYNILRFFEMAGIHKMAGLEADDPGEPGL